MLSGELWRHRTTKRVVRVERVKKGFLSLSVWVALWRNGQWDGEFQMVETLWDEAEFRRMFEPVSLH